jgi:hypothetical protein
MAMILAKVDKASSRTVLEDDFPKMVSVENGEARIKDNPPLIVHDMSRGAKYDRVIKAAFRRYRSKLADECKALIDRYQVKDIAARVVGVGTHCGIVLRDHHGSWCVKLFSATSPRCSPALDLLHSLPHRQCE